ncbi:unnamed protein product [Pleuronectes platessa]|uniref:Uncharacterized protein n=1 Tax=Pleuronectes platessa TaxID=8262 RepID=A0A9N7YB28_PLEPL|nr:unnamed protein product [Pleuronectes platessa]
MDKWRGGKSLRINRFISNTMKDENWGTCPVRSPRLLTQEAVNQILDQQFNYKPVNLPPNLQRAETNKWRCGTTRCQFTAASSLLPRPTAPRRLPSGRTTASLINLHPPPPPHPTSSSSSSSLLCHSLFDPGDFIRT